MSSFIRQRGTTHTAYWHTIDPATGERVQHSKGGFRTKKEARDHLHTVMGKVQDGTYQKDTKITVEQLLVDHWLPTKKTEDLRASTLTQYADIIDSWILHDEIGLGGIQAQSLTPKQVTDWREALKDTRRAARTHSPTVDIGICRTPEGCVQMGNAERAHSSRPHRRRGPWQEERGGQARESLDWRGGEEVPRFTAGDRLHAIWQLALVGGLRRAELCGLKWEDIDLKEGTVRIVRTHVTVNGQPVDSEPKTKQSRRTLNLSPVVPHLKALQKIQKEDKLAAGDAYANDGYLVADALGRPCHPETLSGWFEDAVAKCGGLRRISLHETKQSRRTLNLSPVMAHLKALQNLQKEDRLMGAVTPPPP